MDAARVGDCAYTIREVFFVHGIAPPAVYQQAVSCKGLVCSYMALVGACIRVWLIYEEASFE